LDGPQTPRAHAVKGHTATTPARARCTPLGVGWRGEKGTRQALAPHEAQHSSDFLLPATQIRPRSKTIGSAARANGCLRPTGTTGWRGILRPSATRCCPRFARFPWRCRSSILGDDRVSVGRGQRIVARRRHCAVDSFRWEEARGSGPSATTLTLGPRGQGAQLRSHATPFTKRVLKSGTDPARATRPYGTLGALLLAQLKIPPSLGRHSRVYPTLLAHYPAHRSPSVR